MINAASQCGVCIAFIPSTGTSVIPQTRGNVLRGGRDDRGERNLSFEIRDWSRRFGLGAGGGAPLREAALFFVAGVLGEFVDKGLAEGAGEGETVIFKEGGGVALSRGERVEVAL